MTKQDMAVKQDMLETSLMEIVRWCTGENQVQDGEDAEDALRIIKDIAITALRYGK